jgi:flagellar basal body rod protein FlgG
MTSELYTAASGLILERQRLDLIANNMANLSTPTYRAQRLLSVPFARAELGNAVNIGVAPAETFDEARRGALRDTARPLDLALEDGDFLALETAEGRRYSRGGSLEIAPDGRLLAPGGHQVLGANGKPITGLGQNATIGGDGRVLEQGAERARLQVVRDPQGVLQRAGNGLLQPAREPASLPPVQNPVVTPGWIEGSATDPVGELVRLIDAQRAFEGYQKIISMTMNEVNRKAVNDLAG